MKQFFPFLTAEESSWLRCLKSVSLFSRLSGGELRQIESLMHERTYEAGETVFEEEEEGLGLYVVMTGCVAVSKVCAGERKELTRLGPRSFFGELALLDGVVRSARVHAIEQTTLIGFFRPEFLGLMKTNRSLAAKVSFELARHLALLLRQAGEQANPAVYL